MKLSPIDAAEAYARRVFTVDNSRIELIREEMGLNLSLIHIYMVELQNQSARWQLG